MRVKFGTFRFKLFDIRHYCLDVDFFLFLECIYIAGNVEIVIVVGYLLKRCQMAVFSISVRLR